MGVILAKDVVNSPHNILNSVSLADTAKRIAMASAGSLTGQILDKDACEERGMGAFLAVARGSETPPQLIHLTYKAVGEIKQKVGLVGKGLLFDTGVLYFCLLLAYVYFLLSTLSSLALLSFLFAQVAIISKWP